MIFKFIRSIFLKKKFLIKIPYEFIRSLSLKKQLLILIPLISFSAVLFFSGILLTEENISHLISKLGPLIDKKITAEVTSFSLLRGISVEKLIIEDTYGDTLNGSQSSSRVKEQTAILKIDFGLVLKFH